MHRLILIRHGESAYNADNRFTGWTDVDLTPLGMAQARAVGATLRAAGVAINVAFTSMLKRTIRSQWIICEAMDRMWLPIVPDPRLNERHYGALTGLNKATAEREYGAAQVAAWRRSFAVAPPPMALQDARAYADDPRNRGARAGEIVLSESLEDVVRRVRPFWEELAAPALRERRGVVIQAHGNTIRAQARQAGQQVVGGIVRHEGHRRAGSVAAGRQFRVDLPGFVHQLAVAVGQYVSHLDLDLGVELHGSRHGSAFRISRLARVQDGNARRAGGGIEFVPYRADGCSPVVAAVERPAHPDQPRVVGIIAQDGSAVRGADCGEMRLRGVQRRAGHGMCGGACTGDCEDDVLDGHMGFQSEYR